MSPQAQLWHKRLGHIPYKSLNQMLHQNCVVNLLHVDDKDVICEHCLVGHHHRERFPKKFESQMTNPIHLIQVDLVGPFCHNSLKGSKYFVVFIDDFNRKTWVLFKKKKGETFTKLKNFKE